MKALLGVSAALLLTACGTSARTAAPAPTPTIATVAAADYGKALFQDKGCITCHINDRVNAGRRDFTIDGIPDLTNYRNDPAFLRPWLADPQAVKPGTRMPNLRLQPDEIDALIAFLNAPR